MDRQSAQRTVVVTGAAGFIGSRLVMRLLDEGCRVIAVDDLSTGALSKLGEARQLYPKDLMFHRLDIRQGGLTALVETHQPDAIFHLAAHIDVRRSLREPLLDADINILGTIAVLEAARAGNVRKIVYASSIGSYGPPSDPNKLVDETCLDPALSPYGVSKRAAMAYLDSYQTLYGIAWTALTLANVYGPGQTTSGEGGVIATFIGAMLRAEPCTIFGDGEQTRDFVYVDDVVDAFYRALDHGDNDRFVIGTGTPTSINAVFHDLADLTDYQYGPVYADANPGEIRHSAVNAAKAKQQLNWEAWTTRHAGLAATVDWARRNGTG
jgi:UDP-glucose 4-epimerase